MSMSVWLLQGFQKLRENVHHIHSQHILEKLKKSSERAQESELLLATRYHELKRVCSIFSNWRSKSVHCTKSNSYMKKNSKEYNFFSSKATFSYF